MLPWHKILALATLAMTFATACSQQSPEPEPPVERDYLTESDVPVIAASTTEFQQGLLVDGEVTFAEYERAVLAAADCVREARVDGGTIIVTGPSPRQRDSGDVDYRFLDYDVEFVGSTGDGSGPERGDEWIDAVGDEIDRIVESCQDEYATDIERIWVFQHLLTPAERAQQRELLVDCLRSAGVDIHDAATDDDIFRLVEAGLDDSGARGCCDSYPDFFVVGVE